MRLLRFLPLISLFLLLPARAGAYSLLTHEELIDLTWQDSIVPLLLSRYPNLTPVELQTARSYAYGGCVVQDIGYYPYGDRFFSDLTHYVRSGDFVVSLFRNARNANEMAFAVGALSHYIGDSIGHPEATNIAVPIEFPPLKEHYGSSVNFAEGKHQHVQVEFGFDIDQLTHKRVAPLRFEKRIGLRVPVRLLSVSFYETYGVTHFSGNNGRFNVREYRFAVHSFIPKIADAVMILHRRHEPPDPDTAETREIRKEISAVAASENWKAYRQSPGFGAYVLAGVLFILPKVGPLALVNVKGPTQKTESDYMRSLLQATQALRSALHRFTPPRAAGNPVLPGNGGPRLPDEDRPVTATLAENTPAADPRTGAEAQRPAPSAPLPVDRPSERARERRSVNHPLPNRDLDTGHVVRPGGYPLTDSTYAQLLRKLTSTPKQPVPPGIVEDIQAYYKNLDAPFSTKKNPNRWKQVLEDLNTLASMPTSVAPPPIPTYSDTGEDDDDSQ